MKGKKLSSRVCALMLAVCMIAQLMPAYAAPAPDANGVLTYSFNTAAIGGNNLAAATFEKSGWQFNDEESDPSWTYNKISAGWANVGGASITPAVDATRKSIAFDLDVPESGYYAISLKANTNGTAGTYEVYVNGKLAKSLDLTTAAATYSIGSKYLDKGANSVRIKYTGDNRTSAAWPVLYNIALTLEPDRAADTIELDFRADAAVTSYYDMSLADQGLRFIHHGATSGFIQTNALNKNAWTIFNASTGAIMYFKSKDTQVGFDFKVNKAGTYDMLLINMASSANGVTTDFILNKDTTVGRVETHPTKNEATDGKRVVQKVGQMTVNEGVNTLQLKAVTGKGVWNLYFKDGFALVDPTNSINSWSVTSTTGEETAANTYKLDKGESAVLNVKTNEYGLYYIYANVENRADGFVGSAVQKNNTGFPQYIDAAGSYSTDSLNTTVVRPFGPFWLANGDNEITLSELSADGGVLNISDIELHKVVQKLDLIDNANENFRAFSVKTHGWELDEENTHADQYKRMMLGTYNGADYYGSNATGANWTDINLQSGQVGFKFKTPIEGRYKIVGTFRKNANANNPTVTVPGTDLNTTLTLNASTETLDDNVEIGMVDLSAGEHSIIFKDSGSGNRWLYLQKLTLIPEVMPSEVRVTLNSSTMTAGEAFDIHADVAMNDGTVVEVPVAETGDPESGYITMKSSDTEVITVENGVVTAVGAGTANIEVVAYIMGKTLRKNVSINVSSAQETGSFVLTASDAFPMAADARRDIILQGAVDRIIVDLNKATSIEAISSKDEVAAAEIVKKNGNVLVRVESNAVGEAEITVTAEYDGLTATKLIPISVVENPESTKTTIINFGTPMAESFDDLDVDVHGWELDPQPENEKLWNKIAAGHTNFSKGTDSLFHFNYDNDADEGEYVLINIKVDRTGWYAVDFTGMYNLDYGAVASFHIDGEFIGEFDFTDPDGMDSRITDVVERFRDIYLTEGVHQLKVQRINRQVNTRHAIVYLFNMRLTPLLDKTTVAGVNIVSDRDSLLLGDSANISYSLRMSDGTDYFFPVLTENQGSMGINALTPDRVSYTNGTITANGYGTGSFEIIASRPDEEDYVANWGIDTAQGQLFNFVRDSAIDATGATIAKDNWTVNAEKTSAAAGALNTKGLNAAFAQDNILALDLNILKTGIYDMDIVGSTAEDGAVADLYMDEAYLGRFDFSGDEAAEQLNSLELTRGSHTFYIKAVSAGSIYVNRLVFTQAEALPEFSNISIQAESEQVVYNQTLQAAATVYMTNGREYHFGNKLDGSVDGNNKLTFASSDEDVFTVDENGLITGVWTGEADLEVTAVINGTPHYESQKFETVRVLKMSVANELFVDRTKTVSTQLTAVLDDAQADLSAAESILVIPDNPDAISGEAIVDTDNKTVTLQLTGLRAGLQSVTVKATLDGVTGSLEVPVQVFAPVETEENLDIDFVKGYSGSPTGVTISSDGWCLNYEETSPEVINHPTWGLSANGFDAQLYQNEQLALDFLVREPGNYALEVIGQQVGNYGAMAAFYIDDMYLGEFDFAHPSDSEDGGVRNRGVRVQLNSLNLTEGTHTITIKRINNDETYRHNTLYMTGFDFTKLDGDLYFDRAVAEVGKTDMIVGESTTIITQAIMSDGSYRNMGPLKDGSADPNNSFSISNSNPAVVEIKDGRIVAKAKGSATITVTAKVDGVDDTAEVTINVSDAKLASIQAVPASDIYVGKTVELDILATADNGMEIDASCLTVTASSDNTEVATASGTLITGLSAGEANITVTAELNGATAAVIVPVTVSEDGLVGITVNALPRLIRPDSAGTQITVTGGSYQGLPIDLSNAEITYTTEATDVINLSAAGYVTPKTLGEALVKVYVKAGEFEDEGEVNIIVTNGKVGRSFYTDEKIAAAQENREKHTWARNEINSTIKTADKYLDMDEFLWSAVTTNELPRSTTVGYAYDPEARYCRYCGDDLEVAYGNPIYSYNVDPINRPWKIQCKSCRRLFPSNDFGSFYELGIDEYGNWSYEKAKQEHIDRFGGLHGYGYLVNTAYPEVATENTVNCGRGLGDTESVDTWGVDDGMGYFTGHVYHNTNIGDVEECHSYIAMYNRFVMGTDVLFDTVTTTLSKAYLFTGEAKYGRACAIVLDRLADVYPSLEIEPHWKYKHAGETGRGKLEGRIWEADTLAKWIAAYDAVWPMFDDPYVISFLNEKAEKYHMENDKSTPEKIRQNIEDGIIRETIKAHSQGKLYGNFGLHQVPIAYAGVVLDSVPESKGILDYLMQYDEYHLLPSYDKHTGGEILHKMYNDVDRDGGTKEGVSPNYQNLWYNTMADIGGILNGYEGYPAADLYQNPKLSKMLKNQFNYIMTRKGSLPVGDSGVMAQLDRILPSYYYLIRAYYATGDYEFAQLAYFQNGNSVENLRLDVFTKNPEQIQQDIPKVIAQYGEYDFDKSTLLAGTGFAVMRDGSLYGAGTNDEHDNQRDFWMSFGLKGIHGHADTLGIGLHAYGLDFAPDFGYPSPATLNDRHRNWGNSTVSHNTVVVNDKPHSALNTAATPLHFDSTDRIKVMDVEAPEISTATDIYRRTVVMIEANDDISYGVDFFRVKGGDEHLYSFHAQSDTIGDWAGFKPELQENGTYAGENVAYETAGLTSGYSYLRDVRRDTEPNTGEIMVEFDITDYRKAIKDSSDMHLRLTMLNDFNLSDVSLAKGKPPAKAGNPDYIEFFLARRSGKDLDTTFTTVIEPYQGERYILDTEQVSVERADKLPVNTNGDVARAIKVTLEGGREDYVIYATNNQVEYIVDGDIRFQGFVGVYTVNSGELLYSYLNHGTKLGDVETVSEYNGEIVDFTRGMTGFDNEIIVAFNDSESVNLDDLAGRHIYVENDGAQNGVYTVESATANDDGTVSLHIGNLTLVRSATNITAETADYVYNIAPKQWFSIPLSTTEDTAPVFTSGDLDANVASGKRFTKTVSATSEAGRDITYIATALPRGASINSETGELTWTPDSTQVGDHHIAICADDGVRQTTVHFTVTVYKSAGSATPDTPSNNDGSGDSTDAGDGVPDVPSDNSGSGTGSGSGSGAGGGGGASGGGGGGSSSGGDTSGDTTDTGNTGDNAGAGAGVPDVPSEKFIDLGGYDWAKDAIYSLVDAGVVNGTSENTYSPANNIKRADFAIMLTRAFGITEGEGENFADVDESKYYAEELRLAKSAGIVNGIGNNRFNPEGEITRQDMMLMLARALDAAGYELSEADQSVLAQFTDAAEISDYARDAVSRLVRDGIIAGANGRINPLSRATRAEVAVMLNRVLKGE